MRADSRSRYGRNRLQEAAAQPTNCDLRCRVTAAEVTFFQGQEKSKLFSPQVRHQTAGKGSVKAP